MTTPKFPETFNLTLTVRHADIVLQALSELPWKVANEVILGITEQTKAQVSALNTPLPPLED